MNSRPSFVQLSSADAVVLTGQMEISSREGMFVLLPQHSIATVSVLESWKALAPKIYGVPNVK